MTTKSAQIASSVQTITSGQRRKQVRTRIMPALEDYLKSVSGFYVLFGKSETRNASCIISDGSVWTGSDDRGFKVIRSMPTW